MTTKRLPLGKFYKLHTLTPVAVYGSLAMMRTPDPDLLSLMMAKSQQIFGFGGTITIKIDTIEAGDQFILLDVDKVLVTGPTGAAASYPYVKILTKNGQIGYARISSGELVRVSSESDDR